jgi:hypothetical protein
MIPTWKNLSWSLGEFNRLVAAAETAKGKIKDLNSHNLSVSMAAEKHSLAKIRRRWLGEAQHKVLNILKYLLYIVGFKYLQEAIEWYFQNAGEVATQEWRRARPSRDELILLSVEDSNRVRLPLRRVLAYLIGQMPDDLPLNQKLIEELLAEASEDLATIKDIF